MWHVAIFGNDLEPLNGLGVANDVGEVDRSVLLHPRSMDGFG